MKRKNLNTHRSPTSLIMRLPPPTSRPPSPARRAGASRAGAQLSNGGWVWGTHPGGRPGNGHRDDTHQPPVARCSQEWQMPGGAECPGGRGSCSEGSPPPPRGILRPATPTCRKGPREIHGGNGWGLAHTALGATPIPAPPRSLVGHRTLRTAPWPPWRPDGSTVASPSLVAVMDLSQPADPLCC